MSAKYDPTDGRLRGRALQARRLKMWTKAQGLCARCGRLTDYPMGFELDHIVPLYKKGEDTEANTQVLCLAHGCHVDKTNQDAGHRVVQHIGADGWPT